MNEYVEAVAKMRKAQVEYFRTRTKPALVKAKEAEVKVDVMTRDYLNKQKNEPTLFG